ncbi:MAG: efflux RND transporter permease subunit [Alkalispirochaeta sp.]
MIRLFIQKHTAIFALTLLIVVLGAMAYATLPRESNPEIKQPYIFITTTYMGVSAGDIETLVTREIENELDGMDGLVELTSESRQNMSFVFAEFSSDVSVEQALRRTKDRVDIARTSLPDDADEPVVREFSVSDWPVFTVILSHPDGVARIDDVAQVVQDELKRLNGVLEVTVLGRLEREVAVDLDPYRMAQYGLSVDDVSGAVQREHITIPGGILEGPNRNYNLAVSGEIEDSDDFARIVINSPGGARIPLSEIADVEFREATGQTMSRLNGRPAISIGVKRRIGANIMELSQSIRTRLDELEGELPSGTEVFISYDESQYIEDSLFDLENNMATGFVLVLLVTIFFLGGRNALFVSMAIPLSMLLSFFVLQLMGVTLNMIVLFSLILALGMLVDNGIVIVENIFRHRAMGKDRVDGAVDGTKEVVGPIATSTLTTLLAFLPILFMPGIMGDFMSYVPLTVIVVLSSSLFVALVINPVFCARFLNVTDTQRKKMESGGGGFSNVQDWYTWVLKGATRRAGWTVAGVATIVVAGFVAFAMFGADSEFFPSVDPERARITIEAPQGTPVSSTDRIVREVESIIPTVPSSLHSYEATAGRGGGGTAGHMGTVDVTFAPYAERQIPGAQAARNIKAALQSITGAAVTVEEGDSGPPTGSDVSLEVRGRNYEVMGEITTQLMDVLEPYAHLFKQMDNDFESSQPELNIRIDRERAAQYGLSTAQIASTVRTAINGTTIGSFRSTGEEYDIVMRYQPGARDSLQTLRNVQVVTSDGRRVTLSAVADIEPQSSVSVIKRRNLNRAVNVFADFEPEVKNRAVILGEINAAVDRVTETLPPGYEIGAGAGFDVRDESTTFLVQAFLVAVFLIFVVLIAQFNSLVDPFIIIAAVVLSLGGVVWGFTLSGMSFVIIMSGIGSIALAGVAVNNCIVLVDYTHRLIADGVPWQEAVVEAGRTRLRPVLLTALTTVLALVPMALGVSFDIHTFRVVTGSESAEFWKAFAWTMLYGLTFATISTLVVVPAMLTIKYRFLDYKGVYKESCYKKQQNF